MRKPTDDFFFLFLSVREKLVCMSQNDQRKREREREMKVFLWGYMFPIAPMPVSGPIKEKKIFLRARAECCQWWPL